MKRPASLLDTVGSTLAFTGAIILLLACLDGHYPVSRWLFWKYLAYWGLALTAALSWFTAGHAVLGGSGRSRVPIAEHLLLSMAVGLFLFAIGIFFAGLCGLLTPSLAILWPLVLLAAGARPAWRYGARVFRHICRVRRRPAPRPGLMTHLVTAYGLFGLSVVYFFILSPENTAFDARWYHLRLAEHYAIQGGISPFPEGWYQSTIPHLGSYLYTWAFLLPGTSLFDRVEICAHLEYVIFLVTLAGIPVLVEAIVPRIRARGTWVALFLFPGIFLYDSTLSCAADHIAASWAVPIFVTLLRAREKLDARSTVLFTAMLAGAILTKYQSISLLVFPVAAFLLGLVADTWRGDRRAWRYLLVAAASGALFTAPHWFANWVWHGDPIYPFLHRWLPVHPWNPDAPALTVAFTDQLWKPKGALAERIVETGAALATFSFKPNDWWGFHRDVPVFGFLFTLCTLLLPFVRRGRVWALFLAGYTGLFAWYWVSHQDRYLQILVPWMAAASAVILVVVWRSDRLVRIPLTTLVLLQVVWGLDIPFLETHAMNTSPTGAVVKLLSSGYWKDDSPRTRVFLPFSDFAAVLPPGSRLLAHEQHNITGIGATAVYDWPGYQGAISYARMKTPRDLYRLLLDLGITHLLWCQGLSQGYDMLAGDLKFHYFVMHHAHPVARYGDLVVARLGDIPAPGAEFPDRVIYIGSGGRYGSGLYSLGAFTVPEYGTHPRSEYLPPLDRRVDDEAIRAADFVVRERSAGGSPLPAGLFVKMAQSHHVEMYRKIVDGK